MKSWFVKDEGLSAVEGGLQLDVRLPWYRSLPLSALDFGPIAIDGRPIDAGAVTVKLNGLERPLPDLAGLWQEYWWVLDSAFLSIPYRGAKAGSEYDVEFTLVIHPPYVPNVFFPATHHKRMRAH
jgi:Domain of unknown function (DUF6379)